MFGMSHISSCLSARSQLGLVPARSRLGPARLGSARPGSARSDARASGVVWTEAVGCSGFSATGMTKMYSAGMEEIVKWFWGNGLN